MNPNRFGTMVRIHSYGGGGGNRTRVRRTYKLNYYTVSQLLDLAGVLRT